MSSEHSPHPWKPCDIRGEYPTAVSEPMFQRVGAALGTELPVGARVVVGGDFRLSTPALKTALIEGLVSTGVHVLDAGQIPTPLAYYQATRLEADGVLMVTASHNPAAHNGLKWMFGALPPDPESIRRARRRSEAREQRAGQGRVLEFPVDDAYLAWLLDRWNGMDIPRRKIVLDAGNGAWSELAPRAFRELGFEVDCLFCETDGRFPNRPADCARTKNLSALRQRVLVTGAVLGIAWDGDGDRCAFVDENGMHASTDEVSILLARHAMRGAREREPIVCDIKLSDAVRREVLALGGDPLLERSGHAFMRRRLLDHQALLGLDACGHYFFREAGMRDDGLYAALYMISLLGNNTLGELRASLEPIHGTPELRLPAFLMAYEEALRLLRSAFPGAEEMSVDGTRMMLENGVVLVRESSTEPVVSLRIEGATMDSFAQLLERSLAALGEAGAYLHKQIEESRRH